MARPKKIVQDVAPATGAPEPTEPEVSSEEVCAPVPEQTPKQTPNETSNLTMHRTMQDYVKSVDDVYQRLNAAVSVHNALKHKIFCASTAKNLKNVEVAMDQMNLLEQIGEQLTVTIKESNGYLQPIVDDINSKRGQ